MTSYFRSECFDLDKVRYSLMQNNVQISGEWSKSKPKVDFQYGGRLFCKNGSRYILAINWDMSTKFGLLIDFDLLKAATSTNAKPEIVLSGHGRHLYKAIRRPNRSNTIWFCICWYCCLQKVKVNEKTKFLSVCLRGITLLILISMTLHDLELAKRCYWLYLPCYPHLPILPYSPLCRCKWK